MIPPSPLGLATWGSILSFNLHWLSLLASHTADLHCRGHEGATRSRRRHKEGRPKGCPLSDTPTPLHSFHTAENHSVDHARQAGILALARVLRTDSNLPPLPRINDGQSAAGSRGGTSWSGS